MKNHSDTEYVTNSEDTVNSDAAHIQVVKEKPIKRRSKFIAWLVAFISFIFTFLFLVIVFELLFPGVTVENMSLIRKMIICLPPFWVYNVVYRSLRPKKNKL